MGDGLGLFLKFKRNCPFLFYFVAIVDFFSDVFIVDFCWFVFCMKKFERVSEVGMFKLTLDFLPW